MQAVTTIGLDIAKSVYSWKEREVVMFKVIIWATDGSSGAEKALPFAKDGSSLST